MSFSAWSSSSVVGVEVVCCISIANCFTPFYHYLHIISLYRRNTSQSLSTCSTMNSTGTHDRLVPHRTETSRL